MARGRPKQYEDLVPLQIMLERRQVQELKRKEMSISAYLRHLVDLDMGLEASREQELEKLRRENKALRKVIDTILRLDGFEFDKIRKRRKGELIIRPTPQGARLVGYKPAKSERLRRVCEQLRSLGWQHIAQCEDCDNFCAFSAVWSEAAML
jgi:hypothetical protein